MRNNMSAIQGSASQAGFYYQNSVAALKIIDCLFFNSDITSIWLENYDKGPHIDDIIIHRTSKTEYIQVKWSDDEENSFTLKSLLGHQDDDKSIFKQLAEGYTHVKSRSNDFSITLFTTKQESNRRRPSEGLSCGLADLRQYIIEPLKANKAFYKQLPNYSDFKEVLDIIKRKCKLDDESFNDFLQKLKFKFSQDSNEQIQNATKSKMEMIGIEADLFEVLMDNVVKWSISGKPITKDDVLKQLGLSDRFEDKISHYFRTVDSKHYVSNCVFLNKLNKSLEELKGGYIFVGGAPGIGKSTSITKFLESLHEFIAYYCFIPDDKTYGELRHKSSYFLKSLCIAIEKQFPNTDFPHRFSDRYEEKLSAYIEKLGTLDRRVIFFIDGLDHVHRDISFNGNSLLNQIKGELPDGVFFILSSQYDAVLTPSVASQVHTDERRHIVVSRFSQEEVHQYLLNKGIHSSRIIDQIDRVSCGIPLYLHYISELLLGCEDEDYQSVLESLPVLQDGHIKSYHEYLFTQIEGDEFTKWILAILALRKESSTVEIIRDILNLAGEVKTTMEITRSLKLYSHLLKTTNGKAYSIFHNSFREFILEKTQNIRSVLNKALVSMYEKNPHSDEAYRNYFKHLYEMGEYRKIISWITLDWVKSSWSHYRSYEEIKENIDIGVDSCIQINSLSDFIRLVFIKSQFDQSSQLLQDCSIDFPILLLNSGEIANSVRLIWDGDFILVSKSYFCHYLVEYYRRTGNLLPSNIIQYGLLKASREKNKENLTCVAKAQAIVKENALEILEEIGKTKWITGRHGRDYQKEPFSEEENDKANLQIKLELIEFLYDCNRFKDLYRLSQELTDDDTLLSYTRVALVKLLIRAEKTSALNLMRDIDFSFVEYEHLKHFIAYCCDFMADTEVASAIPSREMELPIIHKDVINKEGSDYSFHKDILDLFDDLKMVWIYQPEAVKPLMLKVSILQGHSKRIYNMIFYLSELWHRKRTETMTSEEILTIAKKALSQLYDTKHNQYSVTNQGLMDYDSDFYFVNSGIHNVYRVMISFLTGILPKEQIDDFVNYWFILDKSKTGYSHYTIAITIAKQLNESPDKSSSSLIYRLIQYAERLARFEQDTCDLTSYLGKIAEVYGMCGFRDDFKRLYNELLDTSFGVHHRKDYRASNILVPLEMINKTEPDSTLNRLSQIFHIQNNLSDAGNGRMHHICVSELIAFTAEYYPELAFKLLEKEECNISRDETYNIVFKPLIRESSSDHLRLFLSLIKTIPRWEHVDSGDNHFIELCLSLLQRAIQLHDENFIRELLDIVKHNVLVELNKPEELCRFTNEFIHSDINYVDFQLPAPKAEVKKAPKEVFSLENNKFMRKLRPLDVRELTTIFEQNYPGFENIIRSRYEICICNNRNQVIRDEYHKLKELFLDFVASLQNEARPIPDSTFTRTIKNFVTMKNQVVNLNQGSMIKLAELTGCVDSFVETTSQLYPENSLRDFLKDRFDAIAWGENLLSRLNWNHESLFPKVLSDESLACLVDNVSILQVDRLVAFVEKWLVGRSKSLCLLKIAHRMLIIDPKCSQELVEKVDLRSYDSYIFPRSDNVSPLGFDFINILKPIDMDYGRSFVLRSYISHFGSYSHELVFQLDKLFKYAELFEDGEAIKAYFEANLLYNKELSKGLPEKDFDYEFITHHIETLSFSEVVVKHLVWLFNYPVIKVRELSMQAMFDLVCDNPDLLSMLFKYCIDNGSDNQTEYGLTVLHAIALSNYKMLIPYKNELLHLTHRKHFNILELTRILFLTLGKHDRQFLLPSEVTQINKLNTKSPIIYKNQVLYSKRGKNFLFSKFQADLLLMLYNNEDDDSKFQDDLYTDLVKKGLEKYSGDEEGSVHREYNINSNFDNLEIQSPYYDEVKSSINRIFQAKITRGCFEESFVKQIAPIFRIYDPSKLLYKTQPRPDYIDWLSADISESDFIEYNDIQDIVDRFVHREPEYITLAEMGSQRTEDKFGSLSATCYFEVIPFLVVKGFDHPILHNAKNQYSFAIIEENLFAYEMPTNNMISASYPIAGIKPLLELSYSRYRGEHDLVNATFISDVFRMLRIEEVNLLELLVDIERNSICAFRWQDSYTSGSGRRRYKPNSEGFTLKLKKDVLLDYLQKNNKELCYEVSFRRSVTKYRPEDHMVWFPFKRIFVASFD